MSKSCQSKLSVCLSLSLSCMLPSKTSIETDMFSLFSILLHHLADDFHIPFSFVPLPNHGPGHCMSISLLFAVATVCFSEVTCQVAIGIEKSKGDPARTGGSGGYPGRMHARSRWGVIRRGAWGCLRRRTGTRTTARSRAGGGQRFCGSTICCWRVAFCKYSRLPASAISLQVNGPTKRVRRGVQTRKPEVAPFWWQFSAWVVRSKSRSRSRNKNRRRTESWSMFVFVGNLCCSQKLYSLEMTPQ